jgi:hypothetical protein
MLGSNPPAGGFDQHAAVVFGDLLDSAVSKKLDAIVVAGRRDAREIFERMKGRLPRIAQDMAAVTSIERDADEAMDGGADRMHRVHFLVDDVCRHISSLKEIAVEPAEVAIDRFLLLNLLNPVDRSRLAVAKKLGRFEAFDLRHLADEVVAQRRKVSRGTRGHAARDAGAVDDHDRLAAFAKLIGGRNAGDTSADHHHIASRVSRQRTCCGHDVCIHP